MAGVSSAIRLCTVTGDTDALGDVPVLRLHTKISMRPLVSPGTKLVAAEANATTMPSALMLGLKLALSP